MNTNVNKRSNHRFHHDLKEVRTSLRLLVRNFRGGLADQNELLDTIEHLANRLDEIIASVALNKDQNHDETADTTPKPVK